MSDLISVDNWISERHGGQNKDSSSQGIQTPDEWISNRHAPTVDMVSPFLGWAKKYSEVTKGIDDYWKGIGSGFTKDYSGGRGSELDSLIDGWDAVKDEASVYGYGDEYVNALRDIRSRIDELNTQMEPFIDEVDYNIRGRGFGYTGDSKVDAENAEDRRRTFEQARERADAYTAQRNRVQMLQDEMTRTASMPTDYRTFMAMADYRSQLETARKELADMEAKGYAEAENYVRQYERNQGVLDSYKDFSGESSRAAEGSDVLGDFLKLSTQEVASALAAEEAGKNGLPAFDANSAIVQRAKAGSWDKLSDAEINIYYNVLNAQGQDAAMEYLDKMKTILSKRSTKEATITEDTMKALRAAVPEIDEDDSAGVAFGKAFAMLGAGIVAPVILSAVSVPTKIAGSAPAFISDFINTVQGKDINPYDELHMAQNMAGGIRGAIAEDINTLTGASEDDFITWGDVYQAVMSSADSLLGSTMGGTAYGVLMGMDAASSTARELYENGADRGQIVWGGLLAGAAEMVFEKWSLDKFSEDILSKGAKNGRELIRNILIQGGVEASEEVFTEIANTISDAIIQKQNSQWEKDIRAYLKENPEASRAQAIGNAIANAAVKVGQAGAGGFISGAGMGISGSKTGFNNNVGDGQTVVDTGRIQEVLDTALELDPKNSEAKRLKAKLKDGTLTPTEKTKLQKIVSKALNLQEGTTGISSRDLAGLGQLWNGNIQGIAKQDAAKVENATKARLEALGESGNIDLLARILTKEAVGESLNPFEAAIVKNSQYGVRVQNELRPDAIRSGNFDTAWAEKIGTDNLNMQEYNRLVEDTEEPDSATSEGTENAEAPTEAQEGENQEDDFPDNPLDALTEDEIRASRAAENGGNQAEGSTDVQGVQLPGLDEEGNTVYNNEHNTTNGGQPNGTESLSGGDRGRDAGERAGGQAGADAAAQGRPRATFYRNNQAAARRSLADVPDSGWQEVTPKSIGIKNGSDTKAFRVIPESAYDGELRSVSERIYQETGATVVFIVDGIQFKGQDGNTVYVRGARIGNTIYVQADHPLVTATQIADHEAFHAKANRNGAEMIDRLAERIASMDRDAFDRVVDKYAKVLEAIYDTSDYDAFMRIVAEEMLADAYAGINAFGFHAEQFGDTVNKWMDEHFVGKKSEAEMEQLRGPPEGQRFSVDEKSVEALVEKVKTGVYKANEHIDFGFVDQKTIDAIKRIYDFDVTGFKVRLEARQIAHILKDHGENGKTDHSMSDSSNIARMRWAMAEADSIEDAGTTDAYVEFRDGKNRPAKTIIYEKNLGEKSYYVVEAVPNTSKKTLYIVTAFVGPGQYKSNPQQSANAQDPGTTAKTAAVEDYNNIVAEKAKTVKQNFSVDDAEYLRLAENPAQNYDRLNEMVRQAAEDAGYTDEVNHGTKAFGFTVIDTNASDDKRSFFASKHRDTAQTYSGETSRDSIGKDRHVNYAGLYDLNENQYLDEVRKLFPDVKYATDDDLAPRIENINRAFDTDMEMLYLSSYVFDSPEETAQVQKLVDAVRGMKTATNSEQLEAAISDFHAALDDTRKQFGDELYSDLLDAVKMTREAYQAKEEVFDYDWLSIGENAKMPILISRNKMTEMLVAEGNKGIYRLYANTSGMLAISGHGASWHAIRSNIEGLPEHSSTRAIAKWAFDHGYRGVIYDDIYDAGSAKYKDVGTDTVYAFFDPQTQLKSADIVTYDDNGQIIPLSERFNRQNDDIRFSVDDGAQAVREDEAKGGTAGSRSESTAQAEVKATYAKNNLRSKVQTIFSIQPGNRSVANAMLNDVADRYLRNGYISEDDRQNLFDRLVELGTVTVPAEENYREAREYLRGGKIYVEPSVVADFGDDWADIRRRAFGAGIYLTTSRTDNKGNPVPGIDSWNHALATDVPGVFDIEETDARKMLEDILLAAEEGKAENVSLAEYTARIAGMQHVPEDEMWVNIERQLDNALQSFAESADIELRVRERTEKQLREDAQKRKDAALEARERKDLQELRRKTQKSLQWLNRNRNRAPEDLRPVFDALLSDIDIIAMGAANAARLGKDGEHTWQELAQIYKDAKEHDPNWLPSSELEKIIMRLDARKINDMDIGALNNLLKAALGLQTELQNRNKLLNDTQHRYISEVSKDSRREIEQAKGGFTGKAWDKFFNSDMLSHVNRLERMVGWNKNSEFYSLVKQLEDGERDMRRYEVEARQMLADFATENEEWLRTADGQGKDGQWIEVEFPEMLEYRMGDKPIFGGTVKVAMTPLQRVHMALEAENYDNLRHMTGGRTFADRELYSQGNREEAYAHGKTIRMAPETVQMLVRDLSDEEKQLFDILKRYYNEFSTGRINQVSNVLYGYDRAMGHFYAPIFTNENFNATDFGIFDVTAEGVGNLKERKASYTPTLNIGALDAFEKHMRNTSRFVGMAIPARNWANYMNYRDQNTSNKDVIAQKWGKESVDHIENLLTTLQGGGPLEVKPGAGQLVDKLFGNYISAVFGVNPGIILKQAGSIPLAGAYLGFENLPSVTQIKEFDYEAFDKYSKDLTYRGLGYALPETKTLKENPGWWERNKAFQFLAGGGAITAMDKAAASVLVPWAYNKVAAENPELLASTTQEQIDNGTSEFWKKVAEEFEDACSRSQSNHQIVNSTDMRDSKNAIVRAFTMFRTDSAQTYNAIRQLVGEAQYAIDKGDTEAAAKAKKAAGSAMLAAVVGFSWSELIDLLMKLWKHKDRKYRDDDGNLTAASVAGEMARGLIGDMAGVVAGGEELVDIMGNILTGEKWYGISAPGLEQVNDMLETIMQSGSSMRELVKGATEVIANDGDLGRYFSEHSGEIAGGIKNVAETAAVYFAGLPVQNLEAYMLGLVKTVSPELGQAYDDMWGRVTRSGLKGLEGDVLSGRIDRLLESRGLKVDDAVSKELGALYEAGFSGAVPGDIPASVSVNGESVSLGEADRQRYSDAWNEAVGNSLEELIAQDAYRNASEEERAKIIRKVFDYASEIAKSRTVEGFELSKSAQDNSRLIEQGVSVADVMSFSALASDMDSGAKAELLMSMPINPTNKEAIYRVKVSDKYDEEIKEAKAAGLSFDEFLRMKSAGLSTSREGKYIEAVKAGFDADDAFSMSEVLAALPKNSKDIVKWRACVDQFGGVQDRLLALSMVMTESQYLPVRVAAQMGVDPEHYVQAMEYRSDWDTNKSGSFSNAEYTAGLKAMQIPAREKAVLWQLFCSSSKATKNPFDKGVGAEVVQQRTEMKSEQSSKATQTGAQVTGGADYDEDIAAAIRRQLMG